MTTKDLLLEVRDDVKAMGKDVSILVSQDLDKRVSTLEQAQWRIAAIAGTVGAIAGVIAGKIPGVGG
jgi:hypothetical protein